MANATPPQTRSRKRSTNATAKRVSLWSEKCGGGIGRRPGAHQAPPERRESNGAKDDVASLTAKLRTLEDRAEKPLGSQHERRQPCHRDQDDSGREQQWNENDIAWLARMRLGRSILRGRSAVRTSGR